VKDILKMTSLNSVFDIQKDEGGAVKSFGSLAATA
jgi:hypothetical protein